MQPAAKATALLPECVYRDGAFETGLAVVLDAASGCIAAVAPVAQLGDDVARVRLADRALLPGFVNTHSHAFQRLIRGRTQWKPAHQPDADFWSWRSAMYDAALRLSPDDVYESARFCFLEMLRAGYTSVGEFHYLQRAPEGDPYEEPNLLARRVIEAARAVGIRICLLDVAYACGGIATPLAPEQRRFATPDLDAFLEGLDGLTRSLRHEPLVTFGVAPHSVRAVPREWLQPLHHWASQRDAAFHIHVAEQPAEVEACQVAYGLRPVELLAAEGVVDARLAAVHATHLAPNEVALLGEAAATIVACPTTERDLGDGILPAAALLAAGAFIAVGSDSQTIIDPFEEIRLLEYHERLRTLRRIVLHGQRIAPTLLDAGTRCGAHALRIDAGRIAAGALADLVAIDLRHRALAGSDLDVLPEHLALCGARDLVCDVWVHGVHRVRDGVHHDEHAIIQSFRNLSGAT
jgi:formimidoylglutamate deiminase